MEAELKDPSEFPLDPITEPPRPRDSTDNFSNREVINLATDHYLRDTLDDDMSVEPNLSSIYKEGLIAKRRMTSLKIRDKSKAFSTTSADSVVVVSSASGLILSGTGVYLSLEWDSVSFAFSTSAQSLGPIAVNPSIQLVHPVDLGRYDLAAGARLADLIAMTMSAPKVSYAELIRDSDDLFISVITTDPRIILALSQFTKPKIKQPLRFKIATISNKALFDSTFNISRALSESAIKLKITQYPKRENISADILVPGHHSSLNPLFQAES